MRTPSVYESKFLLSLPFPSLLLQPPPHQKKETKTLNFPGKSTLFGENKITKTREEKKNCLNGNLKEKKKICVRLH